jgi:ankyrin repeat domain-containing protein 50
VLVYFYFSFQDTEKQKVANLLRSILSQLVRQTEYIPDPVVILYDNYLHSEPPKDRLLSAIKSMINGHKKTFIVIDALDECPDENGERSDLCNILREIKEWAASNLHVLVTSRRKGDLVESLDPLCTIDPISIQGADVQSDIRKFIRSQLSKNRRLSIWPADVRDEIERTLVQGANGM